MKRREEILTEERLRYVRKCRNEKREEAFSVIEEEIGKDSALALRSLYDKFDEKIYIWFASLYDKGTGAFYYSESARDTKPYLPDVESTIQILKFLERSGMLPEAGGSAIMRVPPFLREGIIRFVHSLQDEDGYFYHPQWGKNISVSRRGRDLSWSKNLLAEAGEEPKYLLPTQKSADGKKSVYLPEYLQSLDEFKKYLGEMDIERNSYYVGNLIESTISQITAAGREYEVYLEEWLNLQNRADNGLWEEGVNYSSVNGLMKLSGSYPHLKVPLPNPEASLRSAITAALSDERMKFVCEVYNPWAAITNIFKACGESRAELSSLRKFLSDNTPLLINKTAEKIDVFKKPDGSYSYFKYMSSAVSQRAPVAVPRTNEGDVNATTICVGSTLRSMSAALGIPIVPIFSPEDGELFFELLENTAPVTKKYDIGSAFPEKPSYEEEIAE